MAKKRAFVRYSKKGKIVPGSLIITSGSYPNGPSTWYEVPADLCCLISGEPGGDPGGDPDTPPPSDGGTTLETRSITGTRAFVRYTKDGQIVPGSLIITNGTYPDNSAVWYEIQTNLCCTPTTTTDVTTEPPNPAKPCCTPSISWAESGSGDGGSQLDFTYVAGSNCTSCTNLKLQYSTNNTTWVDYSSLFACNATGVFFNWVNVGIPFNSTYYVRLITVCGNIQSIPSTSVAVTAF